MWRRVLRAPVGVRPRRTKGLILSDDSIGIEQAYKLDMVSKIFRGKSRVTRRSHSPRIASPPTISSLLVKESVNQTADNMGSYDAFQTRFSVYRLDHARKSMNPACRPPSRRTVIAPVVRSERERVRARRSARRVSPNAGPSRYVHRGRAGGQLNLPPKGCELPRDPRRLHSV
jgi:hypothetical protein